MLLSNYDITKNHKDKYDDLNMFLPDLIAVKSGLKKNLTIPFSEDEKLRENIHNFCKGTGLFYKIYHRKEVIEINISKYPCPSEEKYGYICSSSFRRGKFLSYPECCINAFVKNKIQFGFHFVNGFRLLIEKSSSTSSFIMNLFLNNTPYHLYSHLCCSLECKETSSYGKKLVAFF
jgi:hypothetical protein